MVLTLLWLPGSLTAQEAENVHVLPFKTKKEISQFMKESVAKSLGVKCKFCHNVKDHPSDENPHKVVAREMMRMVVGINEQMISIQKVGVEAGMKHWNEAAEIECWICHRGSAEPEFARPK